MSTFYVYGYFREDGTPYYIGKGSGYRAWSKTRSIHKPTDKSRIKILADGLTEEEAYSWEADLIALLGRKDIGTGCLRNTIDGGSGGCSGRILSAETRAKIGAANKVSKRKHLRWVHEEHGEQFGSLTCMAERYGLSKGCLGGVAKGRRKQHKGWRAA